MSFELQRGRLVNELANAGLRRDAAVKIADVLCNSAQELRHSGPVTTDTTPPSMRFVTPETRKHQLPGLDFREGDPDYRPRKTADSEQRTPRERESTVSEPVPPQQEPPPGVPDFVGDAADYWEQIARSVNLEGIIRSEVNRVLLEGGLSPAYSPTGQNFVDSRQAADMKTYNVLTSVTYVPRVGIRCQYERISALSERETSVRWIRTQEQKVLTGMVNDSIGPRAHAAKLDAFSQGFSNTTDSYFNTFRVGKFTGSWAHGAEKLVDQVWPEQPEAGGTQISVKNYYRTIPNTEGDEDRYVLFAARTQDQLNQIDGIGPVSVRGEDATVVTKNAHSSTANPPVTEWYALGIQVETQDCKVVDFLLGKQWSAVGGYNAQLSQALCHDAGAECAEWRGTELDVVVNVSVSDGYLNVTRQKVTVIATGAQSTSSYEIGVPDGVWVEAMVSPYGVVVNQGEDENGDPVPLPQLDFTTKRIRVLAEEAGSGVSVALDEVSATECLQMSPSALTANTNTFYALGRQAGDACVIPLATCDL